jgi:PKD repeat protein
MDYTSENCKNMFSQGQKDRMRLAIENSRPNLLNSNGCEPVAPILADAGISAVLGPTGNLCSSVINPQVELTNFGSTMLSSVTIQYRTSGSWVDFQWNGTLGGGQSTTLILPDYDGGWGSNTLEVRTSMPNGNADTNTSNDQSTGEYSAVLNAHNLELTIVLDALGSQTTWEIRNSGDEVIASGGPYVNFQTGLVETASICATDGCYDFVIMDSNGNGICCGNGNGSYELVDDEGNVLASGGSFGAQETTNFCLSAGGELPVAEFSASQTTICQGESITFTNLSSGNPDSFDWKFFGGTPFTTTNENPGAITYDTPGTYDVRLVATNAFGEDIELKTDHITVLETQTWYADNDNDGYGDANVTTESCSQPAGYVDNPDDCDDNNGSDWDSCYDCAGVMNGSAYEDNCGVCDANPANDCVQDCAGVWGGSAYEDNCGVCDDNPANDCEQDCEGTWGGSAYLDNCGVCDDNPANDCVQDCAGVWGGSAYEDNCGQCDDNPANDCVQDCEGTWGGSAYIDNCGVCDDNPANDCVQDCEGTWGGTAYIDNCGVCDDNPANDCVQDCAGVWGGSAYEDNCGVCDDNPNNDCVQDCEGVWGGTAYYDECGTCDDNPENDCIPCEELSIELVSAVDPSCFGDANGSIEIAVNSPDGSHTISWEDGSSGEFRDNLTAGTYQVTASYEDCTSFLEITLDEPDEIEIQIEDLDHIPCDESELGSAFISVEGGIEPYTISLDGTEVSEGLLDNLQAGTYNLLVSDANGCVTSTIFDIVELGCEELDATSVINEICSEATIQIDEALICTEISNALEYEWKFEDLLGNEILYNSSSNQISIVNVPGIVPETTYTVQVRGLNPDFTSEFGEQCVLSFTIPTSSLSATYCGNMELYMETQVEVNPVEIADEYELTFTNTTTLERYYYYTDQPFCTLEDVDGLELNQLYSVTVRVQYRNVWSDFGGLCQITIVPTPLMTQLEDEWCGNLTINIMNDVLTVQPIDGASVYQLKITGAEIETELLFYSESPSFEAQGLEGINAMTEYTAQVRAMVEGSWTIWGSECAIAFSEPQPLKLNMFIYPNPAMSSWNTVNLRTEGDWQNMELVLFNSLGGVENEKNIDFTNMQPQEYDISNLDRGMYFLQVKHGKQTLTEKLLIQ